MYLDEIAEEIREYIPASSLPSGDNSDLLRRYAVLLRVKGVDVTNEDIHDAWSSWMVLRNPRHDALREYRHLGKETQDADTLFADAVRKAARRMAIAIPPINSFNKHLFPTGLPGQDADLSNVIDLYQTIVASSESLVGRRQAVNTFFLTINGAMLTAYGLVSQNIGTYRLSGAAMAVIALSGIVLSLAWRSLITSFGQLNTGKFKVINTIEQHLPVAIFAAEWEALGRGNNPRIYRSFTSREIWVPNLLAAVHFVASIVAILVLFDVISVPKPITANPNVAVQAGPVK